MADNTFQNAQNTSFDVKLPSAAILGPMPVAAYPATDFVMQAGLGLTPKYAVIALTATGTIVPAVATKRIRVIALAMTCDALTGDETYTFRTAAAGTAISGAFCDSSGAGPAVESIVLPFSQVGWFETAAGALLELSLAGTTPHANGVLVYVEA